MSYKVRPILMTPGPVQLDQEVLEIFGEPIEADYGEKWAFTYNNLLESLRLLFNTKGEIFLLSGSGSLGLDACIGNSLSRGDKIIIVSNGFFGERLIEIAFKYGQQIITLSESWGKPINLNKLEEIIRINHDAKLIALVHHETSTGMINPVEEVGFIGKKYGIPILVDAVSSIGGIPFNMDAWSIDFCVTASQKCLGTTAGLSPVAISPQGYEIILKNKQPQCGWYNNFQIWKKYSQSWSNWHPYPITFSSNLIYSLEKSLQMLIKDGLQNRTKKYKIQKEQICEELLRLNFSEFNSNNNPLISVLLMPDELLSSELIVYLENNNRIKIANGLGELSNKAIRIGHMSVAISKNDINNLVSGIKNWSREIS